MSHVGDIDDQGGGWVEFHGAFIGITNGVFDGLEFVPSDAFDPVTLVIDHGPIDRDSDVGGFIEDLHQKTIGLPDGDAAGGGPVL